MVKEIKQEEEKVAKPSLKEIKARLWKKDDKEYEKEIRNMILEQQNDRKNKKY